MGISVRKGPGVDRHDRRRPVITRRLTWWSILQERPTRAESAKSGSRHQHPERPAHFGTGALLREILYGGRPFPWMNWTMHVFHGPCSPYWSSHPPWQTHSPLGSGIPGSHVVATAQILVERPRKRAESLGIWWSRPCSVKAKPEEGCYLFDTILNKAWVVHIPGLLDLGNLTIPKPKTAGNSVKPKGRKQTLEAAICEHCSPVVSRSYQVCVTCAGTSVAPETFWRNQC